MNISSEKDNGRVRAAKVGKANKSEKKYSARSTATEAQIQRLLDMLRTNRRNTHELRKVGISHPAGRIQDLKKRGFAIDKSTISTVDSDGYVHVGVALYELIGEPDGAAE